MRQGRAPGAVLIVVGALSTFGPLSLDLFLPSLPRLAGDLRASEATAQLAVSLCMVGLAVGQLLSGPLSDRFGRRLPLLTGIVVFTLSAAGCALAPTIEIFLLLRLFTGLGGGAGMVVARAMVRDLYDGPTALRAFSLVAVVSGMAPVLAPLLGAGLLLVTTWRGVFGVLGGIGAVLLGCALWLGETLPADRRHEGGLATTVTTMGRLLADRTFIAPTLAMCLTTCPMFVYISMGSFVLQAEPYVLTQQQYGAVFAVNALGIAACSRLNAQVGVRHGARRVLHVGTGLVLLGSLLVLVAAWADWSTWVVLLGLFAAVGSLGLVFANGTYLALERHGAVSGSGSALLGLLQFSLGATVPPLVSIIGVSATTMAVTMVTLAAAAVLVGLTIPRPLVEPAR